MKTDIAIHVDYKFDKQVVTDAYIKAERKWLGYAGGYIRKVAIKSIAKRKRGVYSPPGHAPYTHTLRLRKSILYSASYAERSTLIGPSFTIIGKVGGLHEHGGQRKKDKYQPRPYMRPALARSIGYLERAYVEKIAESFRKNTKKAKG